MRWLLALATLAGCEHVFDLDNPRITDPRPDATNDAPNDATNDAPMCGTADQDGDGTPDDCDSCPTVVSNQQDSDGDGVGDACDPQVEAPNTILLYEPFTAPVAFPGDWAPVRGGWDESAGVPSIDAGSSDTTFYPVRYVGIRTVEPPFVMVGAFTLRRALTRDSLLGLGADLDQSATKAVTCGIAGSADLTKNAYFVGDDFGPSSRAAQTPPLAPGDYEIRLTYERNGDASCAVRSVTSGLVTLTTANVTAGSLVLMARQTSATVHSIIVYSIGGS